MLLGGRNELARLGMLFLGLPPHGRRVAAVEPTGDRTELLLNLVQLPEGNREKAVCVECHALFQLQFLFKGVPAQAERSPGPRRQVGLQIADESSDRLRRLGGGIGKISEDVQIVEAREGPGKVRFDELQRPAPRFQPDLDEDSGGFPDIVARRIHESRHLPQLRYNAPGTFGLRRVAKEGLTGQTRADRVGIELRDSAPRTGRSRARASEPRCWTR